MDKVIVTIFYGKEENNLQFGIDFNFVSYEDAKKFIEIVQHNSECSYILKIKRIRG